MLRYGVDQLTRRYHAFVVESEADRQGALAVLERVRRDELGRVWGRSVLESGAFADVDVDDLLFAVRDRWTGEIVGTVRGTPTAAIADLASVRDEYALDRVPADLLARSYVTTRLAALPEYRRTAAPVILLRRLYLEGLRRGLELCLLTCEPSLIALYERLGLHAFAPVRQSSAGGFRVPIVFVVHDQDHLRRVRSPLLPTLRRFGGPSSRAGVEWFRGLEIPDLGVSRYDGADGLHAVLTRGMSPAGVEGLLANSWRVQCRAGEVLIRERDGAKALHLVVSGQVEIWRGGQFVGQRGPGDLVGVLAATLDCRRTASVYAGGDDTQIVVLSRRALENVGTQRDQVLLWRNLAAALARTLLQSEGSRPQPVILEAS